MWEKSFNSILILDINFFILTVKTQEQNNMGRYPPLPQYNGMENHYIVTPKTEWHDLPVPQYNTMVPVFCQFINKTF